MTRYCDKCENVADEYNMCICDYKQQQKEDEQAEYDYWERD